ncbi:ROK family transcriptional regulator [Rhodobacteraceae bacterium RKSG542]|uniref:ROK family transcriptional regulator n=1 Tax=Pseudovibrio flavus TaxID=2529854 RepID=UPI0012BC9316|nr:ROK family transcriptional regulator [Pseudovibrio flavus]MTI16781.1 ROK family transcriptional regulator [Pseudovibrio flavus]
MKDKFDREHIRQHNRMLILSRIRRSGTTTRTDIGDMTGLSPATVTTITAELMASGLLKEEPDRISVCTKGRPRLTLSLMKDAAFVVCGAITFNQLNLYLCGFDGSVYDQRQVQFNSFKTTSADLTPILLDQLRDLLQANHVDRSRLGEINISIQGVIGEKEGAVLWSPALADGHFKLAPVIEEAFGVPCRLANDTNMITEALHWVDPARYNGTFAVILLHQGVGMGLFIDNELYSGQTGTAAEFGHSIHIPEGDRCRCGKRGCLEAYLGDYAILREASGAGGTAEEEEFYGQSNAFNRLIEKAMAGDGPARAAFEKAGKALGIGIGRVISLFDPGRIVLTGPTMRAYPLMETSLREGFSETMASNLDTLLELEVLHWSPDLIRQGMIAQSLARVDETLSFNVKQL